METSQDSFDDYLSLASGHSSLVPGRGREFTAPTRHLGVNKGYASKTIYYFISKTHTLLVQQNVGLVQRKTRSGIVWYGT
jgi:hypothetical protein